MTTPEEPSAQPPQRASWPGEPLEPALAPDLGGPAELPAEPTSDAAEALPFAPETSEASPPEPPRYWSEPPPPPARYPMVYEVAYPEGGLSRWKALLRVFLAMPVLLAAAFVTSVLWGAMQLGWLTVLFRRTYPSWLFAAVAGGLGFVARAQAYTGLLTDRYPSFEGGGDSPVTLSYAAPAAGELSRWQVLLLKSLVLLPHLFVLWLLWLCVSVLTVLAWLAILFTGQFPRGLFGFITGVHRWQFRVAGYFASFTDYAPPFSLSADAGPGRRGTVVTCGILGFLVGPACLGGVIAISVLSDDTETREVSYAALLEGEPGAAPFFARVGEVSVYAVALTRGEDPVDGLANELRLGGEQRVVAFEVAHRAFTEDGRVSAAAATLKYRDGDRGETAKATVVLVDGAALAAQAGGEGDVSVTVERGRQVTVRLVFIIPIDAVVTALELAAPWRGIGSTLRYRFY